MSAKEPSQSRRVGGGRPGLVGGRVVASFRSLSAFQSMWVSYLNVLLDRKEMGCQVVGKTQALLAVSSLLAK